MSPELIMEICEEVASFSEEWEPRDMELALRTCRLDNFRLRAALHRMEEILGPRAPASEAAPSDLLEMGAASAFLEKRPVK